MKFLLRSSLLVLLLSFSLPVRASSVDDNLPDVIAAVFHARTSAPRGKAYEASSGGGRITILDQMCHFSV